MRYKIAVVSALLIASTSLWIFGSVAQDQPNILQTASASLQDASGTSLGTVWIVPVSGSKVQVTADLHDLTPGFHGFHIHATGACDASTGVAFESAGGHEDHAHMDVGGAHPDHAGDLPALLVAADGTAYLSFRTDRFTVADLFDADGSAVMIHANADNYANIPPRYSSMAVPEAGAATAEPMTMAGSMADAETLKAGDSGDRVACGVLNEVLIDTSATPTATMEVPPTDANAIPTSEATDEVTATLDPALTATLDPAVTPDPNLTLTPVDELTPTLDLTPVIEPTGIGVEPSPTAVEG